MSSSSCLGVALQVSRLCAFCLYFSVHRSCTVWEGGWHRGQWFHELTDNAPSEGFLTGLVISAFSKTLVMVLGLSIVLIQVSMKDSYVANIEANYISGGREIRH